MSRDKNNDLSDMFDEIGFSGEKFDGE